VHVGIDWTGVVLLNAWSRAEFGAVEALKYAPAVIGAGFDNIDLLDGILTDIAEIEFVRYGIERESPWVSKTVCINFVASFSRSVEGI